jgi:hypothetical protein
VKLFFILATTYKIITSGMKKKPINTGRDSHQAMKLRINFVTLGLRFRLGNRQKSLDREIPNVEFVFHG